ncbi:MAG: hypothetical protein HY999_04765, partial [Nitrospinae bacterium]|nr:hypothetical protein [Nitrospinota bacterium]
MIDQTKEGCFSSEDILSGKRGVVLITALLIILILTVLGTMAIMITSTDIKISSNYRDSRGCFYSADGGVGLGKCLIQNRDNIRNCTDHEDIIQDPCFQAPCLLDDDEVNDNLIIGDPNYAPDIHVDIGSIPVDIDIDFVAIAPGFSSLDTDAKIFHIDSVATRDLNVCSKVETDYQYGMFMDSTTSSLGVVKAGNDQFIIVHSGTTEDNQIDSISIQDLKTGVVKMVFNLDENYAFMADPVTVDIDRRIDPDKGYTTDVAYIGLTYNIETIETKTKPVWKGKILRILINRTIDDWRLSTLFETEDGQGITAPPDIAIDSNNNLWIYFGTGRFFDEDDRRDTSRQGFYGVKESCWDNNKREFNPDCVDIVSKDDLFNATDVVVKQGGEVENGPKDNLNNTIKDFDDLIGFVTDSKRGWYIDLWPSHTAGVIEAGQVSAERVLNKPVVFGGLVLFTTFAPYYDTDIYTNEKGCSGKVAIYALYYETGTGYKRPV